MYVTNEETGVSELQLATQDQTPGGRLELGTQDSLTPEAILITPASQYLPENVLWSPTGTYFKAFETFIWIELGICCRFTRRPLGKLDKGLFLLLPRG